MIFRVVNEERMPQVKELWAQCFEQPGDPFFEYYFNNYCGQDNTVVGGFDEENHLLTMLHLNPYMLKIRGRDILTPFIVGVATDKLHRGQHLAGELLQTVFQMLRSQSFPFVWLLPVAGEIYTPYGFTFVDRQPKYDWQTLQKQFTLQSGALEQKLLQLLYEKFTAGKNAVVRTDFQWNKLLSVYQAEQAECELIMENGKAVGYIIHEGDEIMEVINPSGTTCQLPSEGEPASPLEGKRATCGEGVKPMNMARCIDARAALEKLKVAGCPDCEFNLLLGDDFLADNNHLLHITVEDGKLRYESTLDQEDFAMDMDVFTRLYFGVQDVLELVEEGKLVANNPLKLAALSRLFPKCETYINEYF